MMRKFKLLFLIAAFAVILSLPASAKPVADEFRNRDYDWSSIKTVLVMPVMYDVNIPQSEAFFSEAVEQRWKDMTSQAKSGFSFLVKTPQDIIERDQFVRGEAPGERLGATKAAEKALALSPEYVNAILSAYVTRCEYTYIHHEQEIVWRTRYVDRDVRVGDKWERISVPIEYQEVKPAWDEKCAVGAVKVELRDSKDNSLIYGVNVTASTTEDLFSDLPTLTKHISNIIENAAKRIPKK